MKELEETLQSRGECFPAQNQQIPMISEGAFVIGHSEVGKEAEGLAGAQKEWLQVT